MSSPSRRQFLVTTAGAISAPLTLGTALSRPAAKRPNIIFLLADDLGYADIGVFGRDDIATPNIDSLAHDGVRLTHSYSNSPVCSPTRVALMTGKYQYRHEVGLHEPLLSSSGTGLSPALATLPSLLRQAGYRTALIGKWHLGYQPDYGPLQSGYDYFFGFYGGAIDYFNHTNFDGKEDLWRNGTLVSSTEYLTDLIGEETVSYIRAHKDADRPFLASVHFSAPHWPWEEVDDPSESERLRAAGLQHYDGGSQKTYRAMVERMDYQIGRILRTLKETGAEKNTLIVFTSDNGGERFAKTWPFVGRKSELLEGGIRVPSIVRWPERLPKGTTFEQTNMTMDWVPTFLSAAGLPPTEDQAFDGIDLLPHLKRGAQPVERTLYWRHKANGQRAIRRGAFKALKMRDQSFLFNVVEDPLERGNLKERMPGLYHELTSAWDDWNAGMLPERPDTPSMSFKSWQLADRIGVENKTWQKIPDSWPGPHPE